MSEIPSDIQEAAWAAWRAYHSRDSEGFVREVARALLAERECATEAERRRWQETVQALRLERDRDIVEYESHHEPGW